MKIRAARVEDAMAMAHVIVDTFMATNRDLLSAEALRRREHEWTYEVSAHSWETFLTEIAEGASPRCCVYVAVDESGEVVGLADGCPSKSPEDGDQIGEVDVLYVRQSHQGQGIGRALVQAVAADLSRMGMTTIHICTPLAATQARRFYERIGGRAIGTREHAEDGEVIPLVIYEWNSRELIGTDNVPLGDKR